MTAEPPRHGPAPRHPLAEVRRLAGSAHLPRSSRREVCAELGCGDQEAIAFVRDALLSLTEDMCRERKLFPTGVQADVYHLPNANGPYWYVKLHIEDSQLIVDSFHPTHVSQPWRPR